MVVRCYLEPGTGRPHIYRHDIHEDEVEDVLARPLEDRPGHEGARVAVGQTQGGRYLRVIYVPDPEPASVFVITAYELGPKAGATAAASAKEMIMKRTIFPPGWDEKRVQRVLEYYDQQSDEQPLADDEAAYESTTHTAMEVPVELVPAVRELLAKRRAG